MTMIKDRDRAPASSRRKRARAGGGDCELAERTRGASPILVPSRWRSPRQGARVRLPQPPANILRKRPDLLGRRTLRLALHHAQTLRDAGHEGLPVAELAAQRLGA